MTTELRLVDEQQTTLSQPVRLTGLSPLCGLPTEAVILPAEPNQGLIFLIEGEPVPYTPTTRIESRRCGGPDLAGEIGQAISIGHLASALFGLGVDNAVIELLTDTVPCLDHSARDYCAAIRQAGLVQLPERRRRLFIREAGRVADASGGFIEFTPSDTLQIETVTDFPPPLGLQAARYTDGFTDYAIDIAPARSFLPSPLPSDDSRWQEMRLALPNLPPDPADSPIILYSKRIIITPLRTPDEPGRHLLLDFLGELAALGHRPTGRFIAYRPTPTLMTRLLNTLANTKAAANARQRP